MKDEWLKFSDKKKKEVYNEKVVKHQIKHGI